MEPLDFNGTGGMIQYIPMKSESEPDPKASVPTGLLELQPPENKVDKEQMAEFSTPIDEVMAGPGQMLQDEVMGPPPTMQSKRVSRKSEGKKGNSSNPLGLSDEQYTAAIAGLVAAAVMSKPVQDKLQDLIPQMMNPAGGMSMTGMAVVALVAAILFYFARQTLNAR
jgi:hypothetical protein